MAQRFRLLREARDDLADFVMESLAEEMLREVEAVLNQYPGLEARLDLAPRGVRRARAGAAILATAERMGKLLSDDAVAGDLAVVGFPTEDIQPLLRMLDDLCDAASRVRDAWRQREKIHPSRHGPTRHARDVTLLRLSCVFDWFYAQDPAAPEQAAKDVEAAKREFVRLALTAAGIPCPRFDPSLADTPARSRLARFPLRRCTRCWEAGLAARASDRGRQPLLEEWSRLEREATSPAYHWWMPHSDTGLGSGYSEFEGSDSFVRRDPQAGKAAGAAKRPVLWQGGGAAEGFSSQRGTEGSTSSQQLEPGGATDGDACPLT